jgi:HNH endonuclease
LEPMKLIPLSKNHFAKVDDNWFDYLSQWKWHFDGRYARRHTPKVNGKQGNELMHRLVAEAKPGEFVDHINGDPLDNRAENLRTCDHSTNAMNMRKHRGQSIYKGVTKRGNSYRTVIWKDNEKVFDASCTNERWAAMIYDLNAAALFGEYARLNFASETTRMTLHE